MTATEIGLLMILATVCMTTYTALFFAFRTGAQQSLITHMAGVQKVLEEK